MGVVSQKWRIEVIWLLITALTAALILLPILSAGIEFPWLTFNIIYIIGAITLVRYIFTLHHHPWAYSKVFKVGLIFIVPIIFFPTLEGIHDFLEYSDQEGLQQIMTHLSPSRQRWFMSYIRMEYVFFGIACFLGVFAMIIKMIRSLWRQSRTGRI